MVANKLPPLRKSTENLNVPLNDNPCNISFECLQEASDFVHVYVLVGHAVTAVLTEFSSSPKLTCQSNSSRKAL